MTATRIEAPWPKYSDEEVNAVRRVMESGRVNYWTGEETRLFETEFAQWCGVRYAVALSNGTLALDAALKVLQAGPGDEVIVTPRSFVASASCIAMSGATPVFADIDPDTQNITAATIAPLITARTKGIICVHLAGMPCDMDPIMDLAKRHSLFVIEDCAQAHGAKYKGKSVGTIGDIGAWSFCQDKIMTTGGEGGMITTNNESLMHAVWSLKDHGKRFEKVPPAPGPKFQWRHHTFGSNYRMLEVQAAIGRLQLQRMDEWRAARQHNAMKIWDTARSLGLYAPTTPAWAEHACYRAYVFVDAGKLNENWTRDRIISELIARGVSCGSGSCPEIYREAAFANSAFPAFPTREAAAKLGETSLAFLCHPTIDDGQLDAICQALRDVMKAAAR